MSLEPIDPETALELYLADKENDLAEASLKAHEYRLNHFIRWCDEQDIENLNTLSGRQLHKYRLWRRNEGDLSPVTEKTQMDTLRVFVRWLESVDGVEQDLSEKVLSPSITPEQNTRHEILESERAEQVLTHFEKYEYATIEHVTVALMWHTMMRIGGVHALDVDDYNSDEQYVEVRHRPEQGTPIKNKEDGERLVALSDRVCDLLDDWVADQRPDVTDDSGREPLLTTVQGRASKSTLRFYVYKWTQPCRYEGECPHDRDPMDCEARPRNHTSKCPDSTPELTPEELSRTHLPDQTMYKIQTNRAEGAGSEGVRSTPLIIRTNEFRLLYFEMEPSEKIDWHTHVPGFDEVNRCLDGRAKYTLEREDGSHQTLEIGPMEFVYLPGGARHKIEVVGEQVHTSLSAAKFDTVARLEDLEDDEDSDGTETDATGWNDAIFVDRKRDEVVAMNEDIVSR